MLDLFDERRNGEDKDGAVPIADLDREAATRRSVARFTRAAWIVVFLLLVFNSNNLVIVVNGFGVGPVENTTVALATTWNEQMEKNGLTKVVVTIREAMERARNASWSELTSGPRNGASTLRGPLAEENG